MKMTGRTLVAALALALGAGAQSMNPRTFDIGSPVLTDVWVDPLHGSDSNSGRSRAQALRTLNAAWTAIPAGTPLTGTGYRLMLTAGTYAESDTPEYWASRYGTFQYPVILQAADGAASAVLPAMNVYDCRYLYLIGVQVTTGGGDVLHLERCQWVLVRQARLLGTGDIARYNAPDETLKANQSGNIFVEDSELSGAQGTVLDFVAVQQGHVVGNRIHHAGDWCAYLKGGSAYFRFESNEIYDCGTGGFTAGQGSGFEFMVSPWLHYEAENIKFINNLVHDTDGAGFGVNGGYNILLAYNTLYRVGQRSHAIEVVFGLRGCDGDTATCNANLGAGGWGGAPGDQPQPIPDRDVFVYNNIVFNPPGYRSQWSQFAIPGPQAPAGDSRIPSPSTVDGNLRIVGNIVWNGAPDLPLGIEDSDYGCQAGNPTCNAAQLRLDNAINTMEPGLTDPANGNFMLAAVPGRAAVPIPPFPGTDAPQPPSAPQGELGNTVDRDFAGRPRTGGGAPGAFSFVSKPTFTAAGVTNAASFQPGIVPGGIITIFGSGLGAQPGQIVVAQGGMWPSSLSGAGATMDGVAAPVYSVSNLSGQEMMSVQAPFSLAGRDAAPIVLTTPAGSSVPVSVPVLAAQPGIFVLDSAGDGAVHADGRVVSAAAPASPGETVVLYLTGMGLVENPPGAGLPASLASLSRTLITPSVTIGGLNATVNFSGLTPGCIGLYQINAVIPMAISRTTVQVSVQANGIASNTVMLPVH